MGTSARNVWACRARRSASRGDAVQPVSGGHGMLTCVARFWLRSRILRWPPNGAWSLSRWSSPHGPSQRRCRPFGDSAERPAPVWAANGTAREARLLHEQAKQHRRERGGRVRADHARPQDLGGCEGYGMSNLESHVTVVTPRHTSRDTIFAKPMVASSAARCDRVTSCNHTV